MRKINAWEDAIPSPFVLSDKQRMEIDRCMRRVAARVRRNQLLAQERAKHVHVG